MRTKRQNTQLELALEPAAGQEPSMEAVVEPGNLKKVLARVRRNKGAPGVDGMTVDELGDHLKAHWPEIRSRLLAGSYTPQPVRRVGSDQAPSNGSPSLSARQKNRASLSKSETSCTKSMYRHMTELKSGIWDRSSLCAT